MNEARDAVRMRKKECCQLQKVSSLSFDVEQDFWRGRERCARRIDNDAQREQRNATFGAGARNELGFHVHCDGARCMRDLLSLVIGIDQPGQG